MPDAWEVSNGTDPLVDDSAADPDGEQFGMERLKSFLEQNLELSTDSFADALLRHLAEWSRTTNGKRQEDDITLLVVDAMRNTETCDMSER